MTVEPFRYKRVLFEPWVGDSYQRQKRKILFLGESHYEVTIDDKDVTIEVIRRQFGEGLDAGREYERYVFLSKIHRIFTGEQVLTKESSKAFWNAHALYNFVQFPLANRSIRPTAEQFQNSVDPLCEVLCKLRPDVVVVLGLATWRSLPNDGRISWSPSQLTQIVESPSARLAGSLEVLKGVAKANNDDHSFWAFPMAHPAAIGFGAALSWVPWRTSAMEVIDQRLGSVNY